MIIGIDFDNTIAYHGETFMKIALEKGLSIEKGENPKQILKQHCLDQKAGNLLWTIIQGQVYGKAISSAKPFEGFLEFIEEAVSLGHKIVIISHRTIFPTQGDSVDLHETAIRWLWKTGLLSDARILPENCFFETTLDKKIQRIKTENCSIFIDDLPTVLEHEKFPKDAKGILFGKKHESLNCINSWKSSSLLENLPETRSKSSKHAPKTLADELHAVAFRKLLKLSSKDELRMETLTGGGNNRAYKLITHHNTFMGKVYFRDPADTRDRLWHERAFIGYLNRLGLEIAPKFVAMEERMGVAAYEWVLGKTFEPESLVASNCWEQCCDFLIRLQLGRETGYARTVPRASESAFSLMEHWGLLQERHDFWLRLVKSDPESVPEEIRDFLLSTIESNYTGLGKEVLAHPSFKREITFDERILSPSDFGLHNTVKKENGTLCFIDFEYAGWDDPAKTIADFFAQPKQKVPKNFFKHMKNAIIEILPEEKIKYFIERLPLVVSITNLKWCYIILNSFHPTGRKRRTLSKASRVDHQTLLNSLKALMESPI